MKKYLFLISLFFVAVSAMAQEKYRVSLIKGRVLKADSSIIRTGTLLTLQDTIIFPSSGGAIILLHPKKGRLVVKPEAKDKTGNLFVILLIDYLQLHKEWIKLSAVSG
ncbi:MAG: hypothetical protein ACQUYJ_05305 [Ferruginibacter sp.]